MYRWIEDEMIFRYRRTRPTDPSEIYTPPKRAYTKGTVHVPISKSREQSVVVKVSYRKNYNGNHVDYLLRDEIVKPLKKDTTLFNADGYVSRNEAKKKIPNEKRHFRIILSPQKTTGKKLSLREYTQDFMKSLQEDINTPVKWFAIEHQNTDTPHVHIVIRGITPKGHDLRIDKSYIKEGARNRAKKLATQALGLVSAYQVEQERLIMAHSPQHTSLDTYIANRYPERKITLSQYKYAPIEVKTRISNLMGQGLVKKGNQKFELIHSWDRILHKKKKESSITSLIFTVSKKMRIPPNHISYIKQEKPISKPLNVIETIYNEQTGKPRYHIAQVKTNNFVIVPHSEKIQILNKTLIKTNTFQKNDYNKER